MFRKDGRETPSRHVILTFEKHALPATIKAGYLNCRIRPYIPNPQQCFRCQRFGHSSRSCRGKETCAKCGGQDHVADICDAVARCSNCSGPHPAYSRTCPLWKQEKEILSLKAKENITYPEAKKRLSFLSKGGYAEVVRRGPAPRSESRATQGAPVKAGVWRVASPRTLSPAGGACTLGARCLTPEAPQQLTKSKAFPQRLAPKVRVVLDPTRSQVRKGSPPSSAQGVEEAMEVNVPFTEGSMETATPVPSCSKAGNVSSAPQKKSAQASQVPAGSSGRGRAQPTRLTDNARKPGHSDEAVSLRGPEVSTEEKMEEAGLASDDDLLPSGAESLSSSADYKISVTPHRKLNTILGVISENDLLETSEEELVEGLASQG
ncbi:hypothetical protein ISCGN_007628, partial [Ixodes scapularis]